MSQAQHSEALTVIASTVDETHDGLARFTSKLQSIDDVPSFWWNDFPVWSSSSALDQLPSWPIQKGDDGRIVVLSPDGTAQYQIEIALLIEFAAEAFNSPLSEAEFLLFVDLATGLSVEDAALRDGVALSTRRKQLQNCFRKLGVSSQGELISLANRVVFRLSEALHSQSRNGDSDWKAYLPFVPSGVRCGVIESSDHKAVRYLEFGAVTGKAVIVLHPMVFPNIDDEDVKQCQLLGLRMIWPVRAGCLSQGGASFNDWDVHCRRAVQDIRTVQQELVGTSVPVIALVSTGAYATGFAKEFPACVERIDFVSTCFSSGKGKSRDVYFGDFLLRNLRQNGRMAIVAIQHISGAVFRRNQFEKTLRRVFRGSAADQAILDDEFGTKKRAERIKFTIRHSIESMRFDYLSQLNFNWKSARKVNVPMGFWHGEQDTVHRVDDLADLSQCVCGQAPQLVKELGHLTQGAPFRATIQRIAALYSK